MFIAALFTIDKLWNKPKCPIDEWIKKIHTYICFICRYVCIYVYICTCICIYIMEYYSPIRKNEIVLCAGKWMGWRSSW
jgi:hypothetical protein